MKCLGISEREGRGRGAVWQAFWTAKEGRGSRRNVGEGRGVVVLIRDLD